jgi:hypothetical protein
MITRRRYPARSGIGVETSRATAANLLSRGNHRCHADDMTHVIGYGQAFVGMVFVIISASMIVRTVILRRRHRSWQEVQGTVEAVDIRTTMTSANTLNDSAITTGSRTFMIVDYSYRSIDGSEHRGRGRVPNLRIAMGGGEQVVDLLVDPAEPGRSIINSRSNPLVLVVVMSTLFMAVGLGVAIFGFHLATTNTGTGVLPCDPSAVNVTC